MRCIKLGAKIKSTESFDILPISKIQLPCQILFINFSINF